MPLDETKEHFHRDVRVERAQGSSKTCLLVMKMSRGLPWAGGQWIRPSAVHGALLSGQHLAIWSGECLAYHVLACSRGAKVGQWGRHMGGLPGPQLLGCQAAGYSHLQDHDNVGLVFEGIHTLDQLAVMEAVHDADLLTNILFLFCRIGLEEFPCPDFSSFLFYKSKDLSKFPTANERREKASLAKLSTKWGLADCGLWDKSGLPVYIKFYWKYAHLCAYSYSCLCLNV